MKKLNVVCIIPARKESKRIPRKNFKMFNGKPLIHYITQTALNCKKIDRVIVSSNDLDLIGYCSKLGADTVVRPDSLSKNNSDINDAIKYTLDFLNVKADYIIILQTTSPLVSSETIDKDIEEFIKSNKKTCSTITPLLQNLNFLVTYNKQKYIEDGNFTAINVNCNNDNHHYIETDYKKLTFFDIDWQPQFDISEEIMKLLKNEKNQSI